MILPLVSAPERRLALVKQTWQSITSQFGLGGIACAPNTNHSQFKFFLAHTKVDMSSHPGSQGLNSNQIILCLKRSSRFCAHTVSYGHLAFAELAEAGLRPTSQRDRRKGIYRGLQVVFSTSQVCDLNRWIWRTWHCLFSNVGIVTSSNNAKQMPGFPARKWLAKTGTSARLPSCGPYVFHMQGLGMTLRSQSYVSLAMTK